MSAIGTGPLFFQNEGGDDKLHERLEDAVPGWNAAASGRRCLTIDDALRCIQRIHVELESLEDRRLRLKWWMGYVLANTERPRGRRREMINMIAERLRLEFGIRTSRSALYECVKLYDACSGDLAVYQTWIDSRKRLLGRPVYWYDVQNDLLGGRNNPEVVGREEADARDFLDAERAIEAIERIVLRAAEGSTEAIGVLEGIRQSIVGLIKIDAALGRNVKPTTPRDPDYLAFVGRYGCLVCGRPSEPHHAIGRRGKGAKPSDFGCVPLCRRHHSEIHATSRHEFERRYDLSLSEVALNLLHRYLTGEWITIEIGTTT